MKNSKRLHVSLSLLFFLLLTFSCKKNNISSVRGGIGKDGPVPSYDFDWESATYMPSSPSNSIPMPWNSGTTPINPDIVSDFKKADGWKMVYNTFTPTTPLSNFSLPYFFALYNQYRGLIRFYVWQPPTSVFSTYVIHGLSLYSGSPSSSMLNFATNDLTDVSSNVSTFSKTYNQSISSNGGTWFAFQYELAYDSNIANSSFSNFGISLDAKFVSVSNVTLNGTQTGTLAGAITTPSAPITLDGTLQNLPKAAIEAYGYSQIPQGKDSNPVVKILAGVVGNALSGDIKGIFSAILGGNSSGGPKNINLTMNTNIKLAGTAVTNGGLISVKLVLPGQNNSQTANGLTPVYNNLMGVINLQNRPTVQLHVGYSSNQPPPAGSHSGKGFVLYHCDASVVSNTFNPVVNPTVSNIATVSLINQEVVLINPYRLYPHDVNSKYFTFDGQEEAVGNSHDVTGVTRYVNPFNPKPCDSVAVRCTYKVTPNDGTPASTIVKTYLANMLLN